MNNSLRRINGGEQSVTTAYRKETFFQREFETLARSFEDRYPDFDLMRGDGVQCGAKPIIIEPGGIDSEQIVYPVLCCPFAHPVKRLRVEGQPVQDHCLEQMPISSFNFRL